MIWLVSISSFTVGAVVGAFIWHEMSRVAKASGDADDWLGDEPLPTDDDGADTPFFYASSGAGDDGAGYWLATRDGGQIEIIGNHEMDWETAHETAHRYRTNFPGRTFMILHRIDAPADAADADWR